MTYTSLPNSGQSLGQTRAAIKNNFDEIKASFDINHIDFDLAGNGKHLLIQMPTPQTSPVTAASEIALYPKLDGALAPQLFFRPQNNANEIQMTHTVPATVNNANGAGSLTRYTFLPGDLVFIVGYTTNTQDSSTINLSTAMTSVINIQMTALGSSPNGTNRAMVCQPRSVNAGAGTILVNFMDVNNSDVNSARTVYFQVIGTI
jgi:hypothetical protein